MIKNYGVNVEANATVTEIMPTSVTFKRGGETATFDFNTIINAVGFRANYKTEDYLEDKYENVTVVGDAVNPRKILNAVHEGYHSVRVLE